MERRLCRHDACPPLRGGTGTKILVRGTPTCGLSPTPILVSPISKAGGVSNLIFGTSNSSVHAFVLSVQGITAKLDKHDFSGLFLGYTSTDQNIRYLDLNSGITKTCHHATFDEAWYLQDNRPPAAQLLYSLGLELDSTFTTSLPDGPIAVAHYPPHPAFDTTLPDTASARMSHLPLCLSPAPDLPSAAVKSTR